MSWNAWAVAATCRLCCVWATNLRMLQKLYMRGEEQSRVGQGRRRHGLLVSAVHSYIVLLALQPVQPCTHLFIICMLVSSTYATAAATPCAVCRQDCVPKAGHCGLVLYGHAAAG